MKSVINILKQLYRDRTKEYSAFSTIDANILSLDARLRVLESRNEQHYCRAYSAVLQSIPTAAWTLLDLELTEYPQYGNLHSNTFNNQGIGIRRNGVYQIFGGVRFGEAAAGNRHLQVVVFRFGGALLQLAYTAKVAAPDLIGDFLTISTAYYLYKDDIVALRVYQDCGVPLNSLPSAGVDGVAYPYLAVVERLESLKIEDFGVNPPKEL